MTLEFIIGMHEVTRKDLIIVLCLGFRRGLSIQRFHLRTKHQPLLTRNRSLWSTNCLRKTRIHLESTLKRNRRIRMRTRILFSCFALNHNIQTLLGMLWEGRLNEKTEAGKEKRASCERLRNALIDITIPQSLVRLRVLRNLLIEVLLLWCGEGGCTAAAVGTSRGG